MISGMQSPASHLVPIKNKSCATRPLPIYEIASQAAQVLERNFIEAYSEALRTRK